MQTRKVSELIGAELDAAVALAESAKFRIQRVRVEILNEDDSVAQVLVDEDRCLRLYRSFDGTEKGGFWLGYSTHWELAGPIIERERIAVHYCRRHWWAEAHDANGYLIEYIDNTGPTPLIAAMRAYVASKFGETVELP